LSINRQIYGKDHIQVANSYLVFAQLCFAREELRGAVENQEKAHLILQKLLPPTSDMLKEAKSKLDYFLKLCVTHELTKTKATTRAIGSNKTKSDMMEPKKDPEALQKQVVDNYLKRMNKVANNPRKAAENNYLDYLEY